MTQIRELYTNHSADWHCEKDKTNAKNHQHMEQFFPPLACGKLMFPSNLIFLIKDHFQEVTL